MKYCGKCGSKCGDGDLFCMHCGQKFGTKPESTAKPTPEPTAEPMPELTPQPKSESAQQAAPESVSQTWVPPVNAVKKSVEKYADKAGGSYRLVVILLCLTVFTCLFLPYCKGGRVYEYDGGYKYKNSVYFLGDEENGRIEEKSPIAVPAFLAEVILLLLISAFSFFGYNRYAYDCALVSIISMFAYYACLLARDMAYYGESQVRPTAFIIVYLAAKLVLILWTYVKRDEQIEEGQA